MYQQDKSHSLLFFRVALHIHICMYQQDKMSSWPKGPASDPMHTRDHWLDQSFKYIYNSITEDLGHQSDQTFRGPGHKIWYSAFAPFENLAILGLKGLIP